MRRVVLVACVALGLAACGGPSKPAQTFVVFFGQWAVTLDDTNRASVKVAADWAKLHPDASILVAGYADPAGAMPANIDISRKRAQRVFDQLVADGIPAGRIARSMQSPVDYTLQSQEARRVEIQVD